MRDKVCVCTFVGTDVLYRSAFTLAFYNFNESQCTATTPCIVIRWLIPYIKCSPYLIL